MVSKGLLRVCVAGSVVVLVAGCGSSSPKTAPGGGGTSTAPSSSPTATPTPTATAAAASPAGLADLKKIVLKPSDLPSGWRGTPYHADPGDDAEDAALTRCVGARNTDPDQVAEADSDDFGLGNATISSSADSYKSQSDLDVDVAILHSPKASGCFDRMFTKDLASSLPAGSKIAPASFKILPRFAGSPANVIGIGNMTVSLTVHGQKIPVYVTVAFITGTLIEAEVDVENIGRPVPTSLVKSVVDTVAARASQG
ncbi:MAG: hypothetical protein JWP74_247 [Marmoricola sp.]|nr:hypothetical protein [Marmoricola sp.]